MGSNKDNINDSDVVIMEEYELDQIENINDEGNDDSTQDDYFNDCLNTKLVKVRNFVIKNSDFEEENGESNNMDADLEEIENMDKYDEVDSSIDNNSQVDNEIDSNNEIDDEIDSNNEIDDEIDSNNEVDDEIDNNNDINNRIIVEQSGGTIVRKKRGMPKKFLENQKKYLEVLEKQQKMKGNQKDKKNNQLKGNKNKDISEPVKNTTIIPEGTRRVIVAGKVKYIPIVNSQNNTITLNKNNVINAGGAEYDNDDNIDIPIFKKQNKNSILDNNQTTTEENNKKIPSKNSHNETKEINNLMKIISLDDTAPETKKIPSSILKKMEIHKATMAKQAQIPNKKNTLNVKKIPSKYAKQMENDVKKQTVKNIRNFSDLRRIRALQDIPADSNIDTNRASINELRKLRVEQRKKEQTEMKKRNESNKRESAIQEILKNDKMSKFAKTVAIKNLSVNSRNRSRTLSQQSL
jgi:hypothetical protein